MDTMITGVKGSGKTYYAVDYISKLKDQSKILHNIKGLSLGNNIFDLAKEWNIEPIDFFRDSLHDEESPSHDPRFRELHSYLFVIDECQKLFPKNFKNQDVDQFFQMARHYDIDTYLLTQDEKLVAPSIKVHPELFLRAVSDTANPLPGYFLYRKLVGWEQVGLPIKIRKKQEIFDLYKSADTKLKGKSSRTKARPMLVMAGLMLFVAICTVGYFKYYTSNRSELRGKTPSSFVAKETQKTVKPATSNNPSRFGSTSSSTDANQFPPSLEKQFGGAMVPVSTMTDSRGRYIILLDQIYPVALFPYRLITSPFGTNALVPMDIYNYYQQIKSTKANNTVDPNSNYYWKSDNASITDL